MTFDPVTAWVKENARDHTVNWGRINVGSGFTYDTARTTVDICMLAKKQGYKFATEVWMKNGCRADIVVPEWPYSVIEVVCSERAISIERKRRVYEAGGLWFLEVPASEEGVALVRREQGIK